MKAAPYRVAIVEAQALFAKALASAFATDASLTVVADFRHPVPAEIAAVAPDILVVDLDGQPSGIVPTLRACVEAPGRPAVCVLSMRPSADVLERCVAFDVAAYMVKDAAPADVVRILKRVACGETYVDPRLSDNRLRRRPAAMRAAAGELSQRETEVLKLIAEGLANKEISARLSLSEKTVKNHISRIFTKLNISARTQAAVHAVRVGIA